MIGMWSGQIRGWGNSKLVRRSIGNHHSNSVPLNRGWISYLER